jgi:mono/diheme cytochrome c family protein
MLMPQPNRKVLKISVLSRIKPLLFLAFVFLFSARTIAAVDPAAGEKLFKQYCTSCHKMTGDLVGPALKDVHKRRSEEWLVKWIHNNAALRASGDKDAIAVWTKYNKNEMPTFTNLGDDDIKSIIAYIAKASDAPVVASGGGGATTGDGGDGDGGGTGNTSILWIILIVFALLVLLLTRINSNLRRLVESRSGEPVTPPFSWNNWIRQKSTIATLILLLVAYLGYALTEGAQKLGRQRGYQPEQPIHFSHKLHAGVNQINCLYCHAGAEKSKHAMIPSPNICMNCHKGVQEGESPEGTAEIAKLTAYYNDKKPVEWIKIHNLPDHVYFNHSQHVVAGQVACQTCHGPVETMEEVYQFSSLSMGWCINCHRNTEVKFASNDYYSQFEKLHEDLRSGKIKTVTESAMGGTECQKCHY